MTSSAEKVEETGKVLRLQELKASAEAIADRILRVVKLIWVAGFDGDHASFIREKFLLFCFCRDRQTDRVAALRSPRRHIAPRCPLAPGNHEHDLAFRRMSFVMCEKLAGNPAAEFLEFLCQLSRDAKFPIWHHIHANGERFG